MRLKLVLILDNWCLRNKCLLQRGTNLKSRRENLKKRPGDTPGDSKLIKALRDKAKEKAIMPQNLGAKNIKNLLTVNPKVFLKKHIVQEKINRSEFKL